MKRAPPWGDSSTVTVPPWAWATASTIASPRPNEPPRSPAPRTKRWKSVVAQRRARCPGPSSATISSAAPSGSVRVLAVTWVPGGVWRSAFSIRFVATRWRSSWLPSVGAGWTSSVEDVVARGRLELARGLDHDVGEVERLAQRARGARPRAPAAAGRRPGGACAASSAAPTARSRGRCRRATRPAARGSRARSSAACAARARRRRRTRAGARASPRSRCGRRSARRACRRACA